MRAAVAAAVRASSAVSPQRWLRSATESGRQLPGRGSLQGVKSILKSEIQHRTNQQNTHISAGAVGGAGAWGAISLQRGGSGGFCRSHFARGAFVTKLVTKYLEQIRFILYYRITHKICLDIISGD